MLIADAWLAARSHRGALFHRSPLGEEKKSKGREGGALTIDKLTRDMVIMTSHNYVKRMAALRAH